MLYVLRTYRLSRAIEHNYSCFAQMKLAAVFSVFLAAGVASGFGPTTSRSAVVTKLNLSTSTKAAPVVKGERYVMMIISCRKTFRLL